MGGIITHDLVDLTDEPDPPRTLTPSAVLFFARRGVFFDVSSEEIIDKSKANVLGKFLICSQVIWFGIQVTARLVAGYPLALIEVHTVVHVLCALAMYALWWEVGFARFYEVCCYTLLIFPDKKPQDVSEPVSRRTSEHLDILATFFVLHRRYRHECPEASMLIYYGTRDVQRQIQEVQAAYNEDDERSHQVILIDKSSSKYQITPPSSQRRNEVCTLDIGQALLSLIGPGLFIGTRSLSAKDVRRWNCLAKLLRGSEMQEAARKLLLKRDPLPDNDDISKRGIGVLELLRSTHPLIVKENLVYHQKDFPHTFRFRKGKVGSSIRLFFFDDPLITLILIISPIVYGGIHLAAWNFRFASNTERLIWKIACIVIMATSITSWAVERSVRPIWHIAGKLQVWVKPMFNRFKSVLESRFGFSFKPYFTFWLQIFIFNQFPIYFAALSLPISALIIYMLSRVYLLVESFISLRHVPIGVFATLNWVQNIPHI